MTDEEMDALEPFLNLTDDEIADLILMLMYEETAGKRLDKFKRKAQDQEPESSANQGPRRIRSRTA